MAVRYSGMLLGLMLCIKPPCIPVDCRQCLESLIYRTPARWSEASVGENVARFGTKPLVVHAFI